MGLRQRYRLVSLNHVVSVYGAESVAEFRERYEAAITDRIVNRRLNREREWTESIAMGSEAFVRRVEFETRNRVRFRLERTEDGDWMLMEEGSAYR